MVKQLVTVILLDIEIEKRRNYFRLSQLLDPKEPVMGYADRNVRLPERDENVRFRLYRND